MSLVAFAAGVSAACTIFCLFSLPRRQPNARLVSRRSQSRLLPRLAYDLLECLAFACFSKEKTLIVKGLEARFTELLNRAGTPLNLTAEEWCILSLLGTPCVGWILQIMQLPVLLCLLLPLVIALRLSALQAERRAELRSQIPVYLEYLGLGLSAGLDFRGALVRVVEQGEGALGVELAELLGSMDLGVSRLRALRYWGERLELPEVHEWVRVITLAEQRGASLSQALQELARRQLEERSCRAEEAAARAGVYLILPLMLLLGAILLLLIGPMISGGQIF